MSTTLTRSRCQSEPRLSSCLCHLKLNLILHLGRPGSARCVSLYVYSSRKDSRPMIPISISKSSKHLEHIMRLTISPLKASYQHHQSSHNANKPPLPANVSLAPPAPSLLHDPLPTQSQSKKHDDDVANSVFHE